MRRWAARAFDVAGAAQADRHIKRSNTLVIFINQIRMKIGVMFGNPETTTAATRFKFYASVRWISAASRDQEGRRGDRQRDTLKVVKNKVSRRSAKRCSISCTAKHLARRRIIDSACCISWWRNPVPGTAIRAARSGRARTTRAEYLRENPDIAREIENRVPRGCSVANWLRRAKSDNGCGCDFGGGSLRQVHVKGSCGLP